MAPNPKRRKSSKRKPPARAQPDDRLRRQTWLLSQNIVVGHHATDISIKNDVLQGYMRLKPSWYPWHWLGDGVYFWENDGDRAVWWGQKLAADQAKNNKAYGTPFRIARPSVLGAVIRLGNCLDLTTDQGISFLADEYELVTKQYADAKAKLPKNQDTFRWLDNEVINSLCARYARQSGSKRIDTIRATFVSETPDLASYKAAFEGSAIPRQTYRIICVREESCILECFDPDGPGA